MSLIRDRSYTASAFGHLAVDLINGQRNILLAALSTPLGLTNAFIGLIGTAYTLVGSLLQPAFGLLADRFGARWVATLGILWMAGAFSLAVSLQSRISLLVLVLAALGSAAFHPAGTMEATSRAKLHFGGRETLAASFFFLFGQGGLSIGPALGGIILDQLGPQGLMMLLILVLPIGINAGRQIPSRMHIEPVPKRSSPAGGATMRRWLSFLPFMAMVAMRSWSQVSLVTFLPKYYLDLGYSASVYGLLAALYMGGSAVGGIAGGWLGDRYRKHLVIAGTLLAAIIPLGLMPTLGPTNWAFLLIPLCGALVGSSHSIIVVLAQRMMPNSVGAASGLVLGFTFASGSLGSLVSGYLADWAGFGVVFLTAAGTAGVSATLALGKGMAPAAALEAAAD